MRINVFNLASNFRIVPCIPFESMTENVFSRQSWAGLAVTLTSNPESRRFRLKVKKLQKYLKLFFQNFHSLAWDLKKKNSRATQELREEVLSFQSLLTKMLLRKCFKWRSLFAGICQFNGINFSGKDVTPGFYVSNILECSEKCQSHPNCLLSTYNMKTSYCWLKSEQGPAILSGDFTAGTKINHGIRNSFDMELNQNLGVFYRRYSS